MKSGQGGLSLLELLVVMAIIAVVMTALLNWQMNTLSVTMRTNAMSRSLTDLNDATGYVGDRVRAAKIIRIASLADPFSVNGKDCNTATPCMSVYTTDEKASTNKQVWYHMVYRMEPRGSWVSDAKVANTWADNANNNIFVLTEYRTKCTATDCSLLEQKARNLLNFTDMQPNLVTDSLTTVGPTGSTVVPFAYNAGTGKVTLQLLYKQNTRNRITFTPATNPYSVVVQARNVN